MKAYSTGNPQRVTYDYIRANYRVIWRSMCGQDDSLAFFLDDCTADPTLRKQLRSIGILVPRYRHQLMLAFAALGATFHSEPFYYLLRDHRDTALSAVVSALATAADGSYTKSNFTFLTAVGVASKVCEDLNPTNPQEVLSFVVERLRLEGDALVFLCSGKVKIHAPQIH